MEEDQDAAGNEFRGRLMEPNLVDLSIYAQRPTGLNTVDTDSQEKVWLFMLCVAPWKVDFKIGVPTIDNLRRMSKL